jgi:uncharacterized protein (TIGR00369 family)
MSTTGPPSASARDNAPSDASASATTPNARRFAPLPAERAARWEGFPDPALIIFPNTLGLVLEEVRTDYSRMRLPWRADLTQPAGVMHGGALAALIDTAVVPAIGSAYEERRVLFTIDMHVSFLDSVADEDAIAEGWIEKGGRSTVFCRAEVRTASGVLAATAALVYKVSSRTLPSADRGSRS